MLFFGKTIQAPQLPELGLGWKLIGMFASQIYGALEIAEINWIRTCVLMRFLQVSEI